MASLDSQHMGQQVASGGSSHIGSLQQRQQQLPSPAGTVLRPAPAPLLGCTVACRASPPGAAPAAARTRPPPAPPERRPAPRHTGWPTAAPPLGWRAAACGEAAGPAARRGACRRPRWARWVRGSRRQRWPGVDQMQLAWCALPEQMSRRWSQRGLGELDRPSAKRQPGCRCRCRRRLPTSWLHTAAAAPAPRRVRCEGWQQPGAGRGTPGRAPGRPRPARRTARGGRRPCRPPCCWPGTWVAERWNVHESSSAGC